MDTAGGIGEQEVSNATRSQNPDRKRNQAHRNALRIRRPSAQYHYRRARKTADQQLSGVASHPGTWEPWEFTERNYIFNLEFMDQVMKPRSQNDSQFWSQPG